MGMKQKYSLQSMQFTADNIDIENVSRPKNFRHSFKNGRPKHGFIYVSDGKMCDIFETDKKQSIYVNKGELIFIPKGTVYTGVYLEENTKIKIIHFDITSGALPDYLSKPTKIKLPRLTEMIDQFFKPFENLKTNHPFYYLSCLYRFFWQIDEQYSGIPTKYKKLQNALAEINENFDKNPPVNYYAGLCAMSEVNFRRVFKEYTGLSPIEYRNDLRLNFAKSKLQSGEYNVSEVAVLSGFTNLSFFTRHFKKKFGHNPSSFE